MALSGRPPLPESSGENLCETTDDAFSALHAGPRTSPPATSQSEAGAATCRVGNALPALPHGAMGWKPAIHSFRRFRVVGSATGGTHEEERQASHGRWADSVSE